MKIAVLSVSEAGSRLSGNLAGALSDRHAMTRYVYRRYAQEEDAFMSRPQAFDRIGDLMRDQFREYDAWICICACGIAVRAIAPYVGSKQTDPAVVVMDESAQYAIPVLSGHIGGANALAARIARETGAQAVITTATDVGGHFSPDSFAAANDLIVTDFAAAKEIAASVLRGEKTGLVSDLPAVNLPEELVLYSKEELAAARKADGETDSSRVCRTGIYIGTDEAYRPFAVTLRLIPRNVVLGIGCRRGVSADRISLQVYEALRDLCIRHSAGEADPAICSPSAGDAPEEGPRKGAETDPETLRSIDLLLRRICAVATIDRKADETGLLEYCGRLGVPLVTYTAQELMTAENEDAFASSDFVRRTVGADNVCERSAVLCGGGHLILPKTASHGVTVAAAVRPCIADGLKEMQV